MLSCLFINVGKKCRQATCYSQRVSYFSKRGNFVSNYVISSHTHSVSVLYNFSSATYVAHIHIFTNVSIFGCFLTLYRNVGITKSSLCCGGDSKLQFSGSCVKNQVINGFRNKPNVRQLYCNHTRYSGFVHCCH